MKYRLIALFACSPLTACVVSSPYAAPITNPLADVNGVPLQPVALQPVPVMPVQARSNAAARNVYRPRAVPVTPANNDVVIVRPVSEYAPDALPQPLPINEPIAAPVVAANQAVPYPAVDAQTQISQLTQENIQLRQHIDFLNKRIGHLEQQARTLTPVQQPARPPVRKKNPKPQRPQVLQPVRVVDNPPPALPLPATVGVELPDPHAARLKLARQQYRRGEYKAVLQTLRGADSGGDGSINARHSMYLLLQTNHRLNYCQSVIQIGLRLASRFANSPEAAEALYTVGECQRGIQQQDIARDTWRKLISSYPNSAAARRARANMKNL